MIKKIAIKKVEELINKKLLKNTVSLGFDTAMHHTGISILRTTDSYLFLDVVEKIEVPKNVDLLDGIDLFLDQLEQFKHSVVSKYKLDITLIEDCFFGSNVNTLKSLARFGILIYDRFKGVSKASVFLLPSSARLKINFKKSDKSVKGVKLKKELTAYISKIIDYEITDTDIADATIMALAGLTKKGE